jgi:hypothetical protein
MKSLSDCNPNTSSILSYDLSVNCESLSIKLSIIDSGEKLLSTIDSWLFNLDLFCFLFESIFFNDYPKYELDIKNYAALSYEKSSVRSFPLKVPVYLSNTLKFFLHNANLCLSFFKLSE